MFLSESSGGERARGAGQCPHPYRQNPVPCRCSGCSTETPERPCRGDVPAKGHGAEREAGRAECDSQECLTSRAEGSLKVPAAILSLRAVQYRLLMLRDSLFRPPGGRVRNPAIVSASPQYGFPSTFVSSIINGPSKMYQRNFHLRGNSAAIHAETVRTRERWRP